jgi:hypothetical protein
MKNDELFAFSVITGQVFTIEKDDIKLLYPYQIPITSKPKDSCKKCYGRGYTSIDSKTKFHTMCNCTSKNILEGFDVSNIVIPIPRTI